jgi:hypothetical protein
MDSDQHWLKDILSRNLGPVEAPAALRTEVRQTGYTPRLARAALVWAGGLLLAAMVGVTGHTYMAHAVAVQAAGGASSNFEVKRVVALVRPANLQGACHLCHASEAL